VLAGALSQPALAGPIATLNRDSARAIEADIRAGIANGEIRRGIDARTCPLCATSSSSGSSIGTISI